MKLTLLSIALAATLVTAMPPHYNAAEINKRSGSAGPGLVAPFEHMAKRDPGDSDDSTAPRGKFAGSMEKRENPIKGDVGENIGAVIDYALSRQAAAAAQQQQPEAMP